MLKSCSSYSSGWTGNSRGMAEKQALSGEDRWASDDKAKHYRSYLRLWRSYKDATRSNGLPVSCYKHRSGWKLHEHNCRSERKILTQQRQIIHFGFVSLKRILWAVWLPTWSVLVATYWQSIALCCVFVAPLQTEIEPIVLSLIIASSSILAA